VEHAVCARPVARFALLAPLFLSVSRGLSVISLTCSVGPPFIDIITQPTSPGAILRLSLVFSVFTAPGSSRTAGAVGGRTDASECVSLSRILACSM